MVWLGELLFPMLFSFIDGIALVIGCGFLFCIFLLISHSLPWVLFNERIIAYPVHK